MKKISLYLFILFGIAIQMSCETDANIPIPSQDPKLVFSAFINPVSDSQLFTLTLSDPIFDGSTVDNTKYIDDAIVTISNGTTSLQIYHFKNV